MSGHEWVAMPAGCPSLVAVYGVSTAGSALLPVGYSGAELLAMAKQTEAERAECRKRGAE